ncbi:Mut7-C RNAse domain-containing protein [Marispirochaeta aestuarii]|uniref:Mut7-C RNAse domain-containing protein n=1 Tax=Marispirochaeta aestuarii TaxID=1963862 RepID=UPI0029C666C5|nr:Mut7-C RNAse domain-containing protein [Marispirochaeta aestuarii]
MIRLRFYEELNDFLDPERRKCSFSIPFNFTRSVKDLIESLGVPHVEVDLILVNGESVDFGYLVQDGDLISVYPVFEGLDISDVTRLRPQPLRESRFIADVHLKTLVRKLRMLGFDTLYDPSWDDPELAAVSNREERILLTRDRGLLKRSIVRRGLFIRSHRPDEQLREVIRRLDLSKSARPLSRCIRCNGPLERISLQKALDENSSGVPIPRDVQEEQKEISRCTRCGKFYWRGSHYDRMIAQIRSILFSA